MNEEFVDYETAMKLRELKFDSPSFGYYFRWRSKQHGEIRYEQDFHARNELFHNLKTHAVAPLWQQVKEWLWEKNKVYVVIEITSWNKFHWSAYLNGKGIVGSQAGGHHNSPLLAEIEGIKKAVEYLSNAAVAVTPNNTNTNSH